MTLRLPDQTHLESLLHHTPRSMGTQVGGAGAWMTHGYIATAHGVVGVFQMSDVTALTIVKDGWLVRSIWERGFTERFTITLAKRWAGHVFNPPTPEESPQLRQPGGL